MIRAFNRNRQFIILVSILAGCVLLAIINLQIIKDSQGGGEFLLNYLAVKNYLTSGLSPYSETVTQNIQNGLSVSLAGLNETGQRFSLPLYGSLLFIPFALINQYTFARALWMLVLELCLFGTILLSLKLSFWKPSRLLFFGLILFCFFGFQGVFPILEGSLSVITAFLIVALFLAIQEKQDEGAGLLITLLLFNPQPVAILILFILVWAGVTRRFQVIFWFLGSFILVLGFSFVLIPDWPIQFLRNLLLTWQAIDPGSPGAVLISRWGEVGNRLSIGLTVGIIIVLFFEWWFTFRTKNQRHFLWTGLITLALSTWIGLKISPTNYVILYPCFIFGLALLSERWQEKAIRINYSVIALLFISNWGIYISSMSEKFQTGISSYLLIPLPITVLFLLYWSRWWVMKSKKVDIGPALMEITKS